MSTSTTPSSEGRLEMVEELIATLQNEYEALRTLTKRFQTQLDILHQRNLDGLEAATLHTSEAVAHLDRLTQARTRQTRLVGRLMEVDAPPDLAKIAAAVRALDEDPDLHRRLLDLRQQMRTQAKATQRLSEELAHALQYAAALGREMIAFLRGATSPPPAQVYTDSGQSPDPDKDSLVNQIG